MAARAVSRAMAANVSRRAVAADRTARARRGARAGYAGGRLQSGERVAAHSELTLVWAMRSGPST